MAQTTPVVVSYSAVQGRWGACFSSCFSNPCTVAQFPSYGSDRMTWGLWLSPLSWWRLWRYRHTNWPIDGPPPVHRQRGQWCRNTVHKGTAWHHNQTTVCRLLCCIQHPTATHPCRETLHLLPPEPPADLWITDFKVRKSFVNILVTATGSPRGCVLSPLLFILYTDGSRSTHPDCHLVKYADDTVLSLLPGPSHHHSSINRPWS